KLIISIDDKVYSISQVRRSLASVIYVVNGKLVRAQIRGEPAPESSSSVAWVSEVVTSKLPAKVIKINARAGDALNKGDNLLVLETMKMEVQVTVPRKCLVNEVLVNEGENVVRGKELAILKFT
ncbi:MAG: acetyl-CoA carboxylase biotin carboxyl carrier protein subunit, partial [Nitrososphaerota archaeon]|nr:acetyl-CoA carboxylase biotin carboxyl carrier protein subunit [Nitrososphaerota archaeon]